MAMNNDQASSYCANSSEAYHWSMHWMRAHIHVLLYNLMRVLLYTKLTVSTQGYWAMIWFDDEPLRCQALIRAPWSFGPTWCCVQLNVLNMCSSSRCCPTRFLNRIWHLRVSTRFTRAGWETRRDQRRLHNSIMHWRAHPLCVYVHAAYLARLMRAHYAMCVSQLYNCSKSSVHDII